MKTWRNKGWVIPPSQNARFVCRMERVLEVYKRPFDPKYPVLCMDESSKQLIGETRKPIKCENGTILYDYEYKRSGVRNVFIGFEPLAGKRYVQITQSRKTIDWVKFMISLIGRYPDAEKITLAVCRRFRVFQFFYEIFRFYICSFFLLIVPLVFRLVVIKWSLMLTLSFLHCLTGSFLFPFMQLIG